MSKKELITLLSLENAEEADHIRSRLETEGIECFMKARRRKIMEAFQARPVDIRVYMKDLDRALKLIADDPHEKKNIAETDS